jgi:Zn-dependent M28 family amino/carboxypeptidase
MFGPYKHFFTGMKMRLKNSGEADDQGTKIFMISKTMADEIFSTSKKSLDKLKDNIDKKGKPVSYQFPTSVFMDTKSRMIDTFGKNVLAYIEGTDLKDELVVITAHYDHIGIEESLVYNGADDNGSGTVGLIEIAEAFSIAKAEGNGPRRSILVMPVSGEEKGLLGSEYYSENPVFPMESTVANLNIDMIGRVDEDHADDPNYIYLIGSNMLSTDLHEISEWANSTYVGLNLDYKFNSLDDPNNFYQRSDHYNFAKNNIPVIFYFNGTHEDYHQATDTIEKIDFELIELRTKLVFFTAWHLANQDEQPEVNVQNN